MKALKNIIHPITLITIPITILVLYFGWTLAASANYDTQIAMKKEIILADVSNNKSSQELDSIFEAIKSKRQSIGKNATLYNDNIRYWVRSFPFPQELYNSYQNLKEKHEIYSKDKTQFQKKVEKTRHNTRYSGAPSSFESLKQSKVSILLNWLKSLFIGLFIGLIVSLHPISQQSLGWVFKLALALSPSVLMVLGMFWFANDNELNNTSENMLNWGLTTYGILLVSYFVAHRKSHLINPLNNAKDFYHTHGVGYIFTGFRICLYLFVPLSISLELLTQNIGLGTCIWEIFQNGAIDANSEIILLSFLIILFVLKIDLIVLAIQYILKFFADKLSQKNNIIAS
ncbi:hypothetical protein MHTCC0001_25740 [Flavobacteriaceae bacterium MHTCC 0001]